MESKRFATIQIEYGIKEPLQQYCTEKQQKINTIVGRVLKHFLSGSLPPEIYATIVPNSDIPSIK